MTEPDDGPEPNLDETPANDAPAAAAVADDDLDLDLTEEGSEGVVEDEDLRDVEIDYRGKKVMVPAGFKRDADRAATQSLQKAAEARKEAEALRKQFEAEAEEDRIDRGRIAVISEILNDYEGLTPEQWAEIERSDTPRALELQRTQGALRKQIEEAKARLAARDSERQAKAQTERSETDSRFIAGLRQLIPGWNETLAARVTEFGVKEGYSKEQLASIRDPRMVRSLYREMRYEEARAKQQRARQVEDAPTPSRAPSRGRGAAASALPSDNDSVDDWVRKENARMAKKFGNGDARAH